MTQSVAHGYENPDLLRVEDTVETWRQATRQLVQNIEGAIQNTQVLLADAATAFGNQRWLRFCQQEFIHSVQVPPFL